MTGREKLTHAAEAIGQIVDGATGFVVPIYYDGVLDNQHELTGRRIAEVAANVGYVAYRTAEVTWTVARIVGEHITQPTL